MPPALRLASSSTLRRYRARGRGVCFLADSPSVAGPVWVFHDRPGDPRASRSPLRLQLTENRSCMAVQSPAMLTELDAKIYPGIHYCGPDACLRLTFKAYIGQCEALQV